jgi:hypothetical protein
MSGHRELLALLSRLALCHSRTFRARLWWRFQQFAQQRIAAL